ncbi:uncharacterized protein V6R79_006364 [Siganus canaliculatus]
MVCNDHCRVTTGLDLLITKNKGTATENGENRRHQNLSDHQWGSQCSSWFKASVKLNRPARKLAAERNVSVTVRQKNTTCNMSRNPKRSSTADYCLIQGGSRSVVVTSVTGNNVMRREERVAICGMNVCNANNINCSQLGTSACVSVCTVFYTNADFDTPASKRADGESYTSSCRQRI